MSLKQSEIFCDTFRNIEEVSCDVCNYEFCNSANYVSITNYLIMVFLIHLINSFIG